MNVWRAPFTPAHCRWCGRGSRGGFHYRRLRGRRCARRHPRQPRNSWRPIAARVLRRSRAARGGCTGVCGGSCVSARRALQATEQRLKLAHPGVRLHQQMQRLDDLAQRLTGAARTCVQREWMRLGSAHAPERCSPHAPAARLPRATRERLLARDPGTPPRLTSRASAPSRARAARAPRGQSARDPEPRFRHRDGRGWRRGDGCRRRGGR